jgi:hypothetical protein
MRMDNTTASRCVGSFSLPKVKLLNAYLSINIYNCKPCRLAVNPFTKIFSRFFLNVYMGKQRPLSEQRWDNGLARRPTDYQIAASDIVIPGRSSPVRKNRPADITQMAASQASQKIIKKG